MKKLFTIFSLLLVVSFAYITPSFANDNYLNELTHYAVWKQSQKITVWVQPSPYAPGIYDAFREWMIAGGGCLKFVDANTKNNANVIEPCEPTCLS